MGRCVVGLGQHSADAAGNPVVHSLQCDRRGNGDSRGLEGGGAELSGQGLAAVHDAVPPGGLPLPGHRVGDGGRGRVERQHRGRVRHLQGTDAERPRVGGPDQRRGGGG